jgi:hypothetical protein
VSFKDTCIIWVAGGYKGSISDIDIMREKFLGCLTANEIVLADKGYQGVSPQVLTPYKGGHLTSEQKCYNYKQTALRAAVENVNARIKLWGVTASTWRGEDYIFLDQCFKVVCKLVNLNIALGEFV